MDRFVWASSNQYEEEENVLAHSSGVRLYDGENKTHFDNGNLILTNFRLIWDDANQQDRTIALGLELVKKLDEESAGLFKSAKTLVSLNAAPPHKEPGPAHSSPNSFIKLSFRSGGQVEHLNHTKGEPPPGSLMQKLQFHTVLSSALSKKEWVKSKSTQQKSGTKTAIHQRHAGIGGIQRKMEEKYRDTDQSISLAFKDLDALMEKAKEMVDIAEKFCSKLKDKQVSITDDETIQFKSYLLSMGIANPVTRETHGSGVTYHEELAKQLAAFVKDIIDEEGGVMTLTEVYCRFNRARGMELVSPEDLINAAKQFERLRIPLKFHQFESGVLVIQSSLLSDAEMMKSTIELVRKEGSLSSEEFAARMKIAVALAKERLLAAERMGKLCRDDTIEGLRFYPNKFLEAL